jgi:Fe(3+) dicitrate transport protein
VHTRQDARVFQSLTLKAGQVSEVSDETYLGLTRDDFRSNPLRRYSGSQMDKLTVSQNLLTLTHFVRLSKNLNITTTGYQTTFARNWYKLDHLRDTAGQSVKIDALLNDPGKYTLGYRWVTGEENSGADALVVRASNRSYQSRGVQSVVRYTIMTGKVEHSIDYGLRVHSDMMDRFQWDDRYRMAGGVMMLTTAGIPGTESNRVERADAVASYVQYAVRHGKVLITPGVRHEHIRLHRDDYGKGDPGRTGEELKVSGNVVSAWMPGIGFSYFVNRHITLLGGVHKGFAPPGSKEGTRPEESISWELGTRIERHAFRIQMTAFANNYSNLLGTDLAASGGSGTGDLFNGGEVFAHGVELSAAIDLMAMAGHRRFSLPVSLAYTYTDAEFRNTFKSDFSEWGSVVAGDKFPYLSRHQLSVTAGWESRAYGLHLNTRHTGAMRTAPGQGDISPDQRLDSYLVLDMCATWRTSEKVQLFTSITNLTDAIYVVAMRPAGLRPGMPRTAQIGIRAQL